MIETATPLPSRWPFVFRVLLKAAALFGIVNLLFALTNPLPLIGRLSIYNILVPGRERLPYGEQPEAYNLSLDSVDAMFASHEISRSKPDDEYRILIAGDSSVWGILLRPEEMLSAQINNANLILDHRQARAYNIGHPVLSATKDLMLIDTALHYEPDMILWLVTLQSLPVEGQLTAPQVRNNGETLQSLISEYDLPLDDGISQLRSPDFLQRTLVGQRRAIADWWRLQLYGFNWAQTGIDQVYGDYTPRANDFEPDTAWQGRTEADGLNHDDLFIEALAAADEQLSVPLLIINEPIYIADGVNSDLRYNFWYPRWAYDRYRDLMQQTALENDWNYLDLWDSIASEEFTDSPVHLTPQGSAQLAQVIIEALNETPVTAGADTQG
jgi:hypothetical protein